MSVYPYYDVYGKNFPNPTIKISATVYYVRSYDTGLNKNNRRTCNNILDNLEFFTAAAETDISIEIVLRYYRYSCLERFLRN